VIVFVESTFASRQSSPRSKMRGYGPSWPSSTATGRRPTLRDLIRAGAPLVVLAEENGGARTLVLARLLVHAGHADRCAPPDSAGLRASPR
jgi:hypothetical protein